MSTDPYSSGIENPPEDDLQSGDYISPEVTEIIHLQKRIAELEKGVNVMGYTAQAALNQGTKFHAGTLKEIATLADELLPPKPNKEGGGDE